MTEILVAVYVESANACAGLGKLTVLSHQIIICNVSPQVYYFEAWHKPVFHMTVLNAIGVPLLMFQ